MRMLFYPLILFISLSSQAQTSVTFKTEGFLDTFYAYDSNRPHGNKRAFTTQAARHNQPTVNLAYLGATYQSENYRGRLALQAGESVNQNTILEPDGGRSWGDAGPRNIQEAYVGARLSPLTWLDGGIYLGHIGAESWISKDNWTYTRALNLDYVPYYSAGLRLTHELNEKESFQFHLMNGWQNMSENNQAKSVGFQFVHTFTEKLKLTYNNFFGDEKLVSNKSRFRAYHNFILRWLYSEKWQFLAALDFGHQSQQQKHGVDALFAATFTVRRVLNENQSLAFRAETYQDSHETTVITPQRKGFEVYGASVNFDQKIAQTILWRTEAKGLQSQHPLYPSQKKLQTSDGLLVTSLSLWF